MRRLRLREAPRSSEAERRPCESHPLMARSPPSLFLLQQDLPGSLALQASRRLLSGETQNGPTAALFSPEQKDMLGLSRAARGHEGAPGFPHLLSELWVSGHKANAQMPWPTPVSGHKANTQMPWPTPAQDASLRHIQGGLDCAQNPAKELGHPGGGDWILKQSGGGSPGIFWWQLKDHGPANAIDCLPARCRAQHLTHIVPPTY